MTSPSALRVLQHAEDARPAWLWSQDGQRLIWSNDVAGLFLAKLKKNGLKRYPPAVPIKGQVARIIRLGSFGRSSLARIQFTAGEKPVSATCATTPLVWENDEPVLLIVHVDPIAPEILEAALSLQGARVERVAGPDGDRLELVADQASDASADEEAPEGEAAHAEQSAADDHVPVSSSEEAKEPKHETQETAANEQASDEQSYARELKSWDDSDTEIAPLTETPPEQAIEHDGASEDDPAWSEPEAIESDSETQDHYAADDLDDDAARQADEARAEADTEVTLADVSQRLSSLVDRLASQDTLYTPLGEADDVAPQTLDAEDDDTDVKDASDAADDAAEDTDEDPPVYRQPTPVYRIIGRGFTPLDADKPQDPEAEAPEDTRQGLGSLLAPMDVTNPSDSDEVERVSRYNFDELSRVLNERVGDKAPGRELDTEAQPAITEALKAGSLVNLGGETLVLNRLPLGILVFRDQQVLFANRAITEMIGYDTVEQLRDAGLAAVFPGTGADGHEAGPVNHLVQRNGTLVPVTARLQSISWHGRPALMLSASATEVRTGHEEAVKAFAATFAEIRGDGFIEANRNGTVSAANAAAKTLFNSTALVGTRLSSLVGDADLDSLQAFLERPARFAETARPCLTLRGKEDKTDLLLFAVGQAGILSGYFGFVRAREPALALPNQNGDIDPALLARISRGVRRPLNTIIGFSDIIRSEAFGALNNDRYSEYAQDISRAGQEIAALVDELDDYARLRDGRYLPQRASVELTSLLESCVLRIREQANSARVIVRNAISETLPRVTADRASLAQAVLNLLASAIDQTPPGGAVVISAQHMDDNGIAIHVRDSSLSSMDMAERFVVFRDGVGKDGQALQPVRSSVGLALTRSLLAVNAVSLSVDPAGPEGLLFSLRIPEDLVEK